ncbi:MAG: DUF938 domain-containing protein [bacterium]
MLSVKRHAPAVARNRDAIAQVLLRHFPRHGLILEVASGTGEHIVHFAAAMPKLQWQPSDVDPEARASVHAWVRELKLGNVLAPLELDTRSEPWPVTAAAAVVCINMIHISAWESCLALMRGASRILPPGALLFTYGPYKVDGQHTAPSNEVFDANLRARDPSWGVRDLEDVTAAANANGLSRIEMVSMPANNLSLVFRKRPTD